MHTLRAEAHPTMSLAPFRVILAVLGFFLLDTAAADAGTITLAGSNGPTTGWQSATAVVTFGNGTATVVLTNTTPRTQTSNQLLGGLLLDFVGVNPATVALGSATAASRTIGTTGGHGTWSDLANVNLLTAAPKGRPTWEVRTNGSALQLDFLPDVKYAIVGAPDAATGRYAMADAGIVGSRVHNPYVALTATFVLTSSQFRPTTQVASASFLFGTDLRTVVTGRVVTPVANARLATVPVPPAAALGLGALAALGAVRLARRRA